MDTTNQGQPGALNDPNRKDRKLVVQELKEFGRGRTLPENTTVRDLIEEGRRY